MERSSTFFLSDAHLGATYISDRRAHERRIVDWLEEIAPRARELYLLGDILDYWFEYRHVVPRGYVRFFGALAALADSGTAITWMRGNHDIWLFDYLAGEIGLTVADNVIEREIDGKRFVMAHGDGIGHQSHTFTLLRGAFRNRLLQRLYATIHPRWTVGFAHSWSSHNRMHGHKELLTSLPADDRYIAFADRWAATHGRPADYYVFGHRHIAIDQAAPSGGRVIVLGDAFENFTYGEFDGSSFRLQKMANREHDPRI